MTPMGLYMESNFKTAGPFRVFRKVGGVGFYDVKMQLRESKTALHFNIQCCLKEKKFGGREC